MVNVKAMRKMAESLRDVEVFGERYSAADMLDAAASELAERRREPVVSAGPTVAERLVAYRCAAMAYAHAPPVAEDAAHAMLAAERAPEGADRG